MIFSDKNSREDDEAMATMTVTEATRVALGLLVERETRRVGSRDVAYEIVSQTVGVSASWIKKFLAKHAETKEPRITIFMNIRTAYERMCNRVEQEHLLELEKIRLIRGELNAADGGFVEMVERAPRAAKT